MKTFSTQTNIGKAKYVISFNDGVKKHKDGSVFYDAVILSNKKVFEDLQKTLQKDGYTQTN